MGLSKEQRTEMNGEARRLRGVGQPEIAQKIRTALDEDVYYMGLVVVPAVQAVPQPKPQAKKSAWVAYALETSNIDPEIIESATRTDIIGMLKANGLLD